MNKIFKTILVIISVIVLGGFVLYQIYDEPLPSGQEGPEAEKLADEMLNALNKQAWDSVEMISWSYPPNHHFTWFKKRDSVIVSWDNKIVYLNTNTNTGKAESIESKSKKDSLDIIDEAYSYFINDSFWLIAPFKVRDKGTIRKLVDYNGRDALLVTYSSGGLTPGDSYLWILDEDKKPTAWKFWVQIIPIGGIEFSWEKWKNIDGALISTLHKGPIDLEITNLKGK